jgi:hypothetical protein
MPVAPNPAGIISSSNKHRVPFQKRIFVSLQLAPSDEGKTQHSRSNPPQFTTTFYRIYKCKMAAFSFTATQNSAKTVAMQTQA